MAVLSKKEKVELATLIAEAVVTALKENSPNSRPSAKSRKSANEAPSSEIQKKTTTSDKKLTIADFEPKGSKCKKGYMNWNSYNSQRTKYCYFVATNGEVKDGKVFGTPWYKKVDYAKYNKAKEQYEKKYHYIKVEDRA